MKMRTVQCTACSETLKLSDFYKAKTAYGHMRVCKSCHKARVAQRQLDRYSSDPEFRAQKIKRVGTRQSERYSSDPEFRAQKIKRVGTSQSERYSSDPEFRAQKIKRVGTRQSERYKEDTKYALRKRMSVAIRLALKSGKSGRKWEDLLGYEVSTLIKHLEGCFLEGMSWENFGEWHIDHVIPQAAFSFDSECDPQFKECWSLANLQPLWASDNLSKSDFLPGGSRARNQKK